jgi:hypothetical protein
MSVIRPDCELRKRSVGNDGPANQQKSVRMTLTRAEGDKSTMSNETLMRHLICRLLGLPNIGNLIITD